MENNGIIGVYRGVPVYIKPDHEIKQIIIPESMARMLENYHNLQFNSWNLKLQEIFNFKNKED